MADCCQKKSCELENVSRKQSKVLWVVLFINLAMFIVEFAAGMVGNSISLIGDSLDMFGDAIAYGSSLYVINLGVGSKARSALLKGGIMLATSLAILGRVIYQTVIQITPEFQIMGGIGFIALLANFVCLALLSRHRSDDINMSSIWLCSRNDIIANIAVLIGAGLVYLTRSPWPDLLIGFALTGLFIISAFKVIITARNELDFDRKGSSV
jgi:Co/Zn/Cd efflux system component